MSNTKNAGRKIGSTNSIRKDLRKELTELFLSKFKEEMRNIKTLEPESRVRVLLGVLPYLIPKYKSATNLTNEEVQIQQMVYECILPDIKKLNYYLNVLPSEKKASILLSFIKQLNINTSQSDEIMFSLQNKGRNIK